MIRQQMSEKTKRKISRSHKRLWKTSKYREKMKVSLTGRKFSRQARKNMSIAFTGLKHKKFSKRGRKNMSLSKLGVPLSEKHKRAIKRSWKKRKKIAPETNGNNYKYLSQMKLEARK